jgi:hypothetical protein
MKHWTKLVVAPKQFSSSARRDEFVTAPESWLHSARPPR